MTAAPLQAGSVVTTLDIDQIRIDGGTQPRDHINVEVAERYKALIEDGQEFPPVTVFFDGKSYWLADGFHRITAWGSLGWEEVPVEVISGSLRDAQWHSFSVNALHGYPRRDTDIAKILARIFADDEWRDMPVRDIAEHTGISKSVVFRRREQILYQAKPKAHTTLSPGGQSGSEAGEIQPREPAPTPEWRQTDIKDFTGKPASAEDDGDEYEPDEGQRCTNCAHCVWHDAFNGYECTVYHKQTYHDAIIGETCPMWEPGPDPEDGPPEPEPAPRFPPAHARPAEHIRWLIEELLKAQKKLTPEQVAATVSVDVPTYRYQTATVAAWLDDFSDHLLEKEDDL